MKVKELIEYLQSCHPEATILVSAPYHNGMANSLIFEMAIEPELERVGDYGNEVTIDIADYQIPIN